MPLNAPVRLWVVTPSYGDVASFSELHQRIHEVALRSPALRGLSLCFVVVDDTGGLDQEIAKLDTLADVRVVTPPFNVGHQRAIVLGLRVILPEVADSDLIVTMDADGEDRPEDLERLLAPLLDEPENWQSLCVARRTERKESLQFRMLYLVFRALFRVGTGTTVRSGNYAAYRGWIARRMLQHPSFDLCYSSALVAFGLDVRPVPCPRGERYAGQSKMSLQRLVMHGVRMLMPFTDRLAIRAFVLFSVTLAIGVLMAATVLATKIFTTAAVPGWATATLLGILVLSFLALGNFVVLFVVFSHSRGVSLSGLEESLDRIARGAPH